MSCLIQRDVPHVYEQDQLLAGSLTCPNPVLRWNTPDTDRKSAAVLLNGIDLGALAAVTAATERTHAEDGISPAVSGGSAGRAALPVSLHLARVHSAPSIADALYGHMLCAAAGWIMSTQGSSQRCHEEHEI